jgi:hypothetical protein
LGARVRCPHRRVRRRDWFDDRAAARLDTAGSAGDRIERAGAERADRERCSERDRRSRDERITTHERVTTDERVTRCERITGRVARSVELRVGRAEAKRIADTGQHALPLGAAGLQRRAGRDRRADRTKRDRCSERDRRTEWDRRAGRTERDTRTERDGDRVDLTIAERVRESQRWRLSLTVAVNIRITEPIGVTVDLA